MLDFWDILVYIASAGGVGFMLFLLGYGAFSIVKHGKLNRLKQEAEIRKIENLKIEDYLRDIDESLKKEIDSATHTKQHQSTNNHSHYKNTASFGTLSDRVFKLIEKGIGIAEKGFDIIGQKVDKKYNETNL